MNAKIGKKEFCRADANLRRPKTKPNYFFLEE